MRDYAAETEKRVAFIKDVVRRSAAQGIVFGNSGGKDSALVGILCKRACDNTLGVMLPCQSRRNYDEDIRDASELAQAFDIKTITVDLTSAKEHLFESIAETISITDIASANINPRLRMATLYCIAQSRKCLVAGTGNLSEYYAGYFTKWGDGAYDFNPIADLTVTEVYEFLRHLGAPESVIDKAPSAALFEGQTDEEEMGVTYKELDQYIRDGSGSPETIARIERLHKNSEHKRRPIIRYGEGE